MVNNYFDQGFVAYSRCDHVNPYMNKNIDSYMEWQRGYDCAKKLDRNFK